jgi:hypothetical protein
VLLTAKYYEMKCNNFIIENYDWSIKGKLNPISPVLPNVPKNLSSVTPFIPQSPSDPGAKTG